MKFYEVPLESDAWIYPCSVEQIRNRILQFPAEDVAGLDSIRLVPSTRTDHDANARYEFDEAPKITIYPYSADLKFRLRAGSRESDVKRTFWIDANYGMRVVREGSRFISCWDKDELNEFILDFVIAHEVGHHVYYKMHRREYDKRRKGAEAFADAYGLNIVHEESAVARIHFSLVPDGARLIHRLGASR